MNDDDDFGFSFVDETDISSVLESKKDSERLVVMYKMISRFLDNLEKSPEKEYLHWPDRGKKVAAFRKRVDDLVKK